MREAEGKQAKVKEKEKKISRPSSYEYTSTTFKRHIAQNNFFTHTWLNK